MRITVGHVVIVSAVGVGLIFGPLSSSGWLKRKAKAAKEEFHSLMGLFKSGEAETNKKTPPQKLASPQKNTLPPMTSVPVQDGKSPSAVKTAASSPKVKAAPKKKKIVKKKKSRKKVKKKSKKKRKKVFRKKKFKKVVKKIPLDPLKKLEGTYVEMELVTGRTVKGIYQGKSATDYTLEIVGMGPFKYPIKNVKVIKPAQ